jgi:sulfate permease, SulP family
MTHAPEPSSLALRFDVIAGLTAAAVVLPKAMAYAAVAGLPVSVGLYTAFVPMIVYALLGTSRVLSVSSTTTLAILAGTELGLAVPDGDPAKLITATATSLGIALMSFTETIAAGRAFARQTEPPIKPNRELLATGAANFSGAFFGAMPAGGGTSQTAVVRSVVGRTQKASLVTAATAAATMLVLAPLLGLLPQAVLAAIVIVYSVGLIDPAEFVSIRKIRTMEFTWALAAFAGVLVFGTLQGIVVATVLSLVGLSNQAANPNVYVIGRKRGADVLRPLSHEHPDDETFDGLLILRSQGRLFFANAQQVGDLIRALVAEHRPTVLTLDMSRVTDIEYSALQMLVDGERRMTAEGITVWLAGLNPSVLQSIRSSPLADRLGQDRLLFNARAAIKKYQER